MKPLLPVLLLGLSLPVHAHWQPSGQLSWHIQFTDKLDPGVKAQVVDIDLFESRPGLIAELHKRGKKVICYFSAGSSEDWRADFRRLPAHVRGKPLDGWPGEQWLDVRQLDILGPVMQDRLDLAARKRCDGVEVDNIDGHVNDTGFPLAPADQLAYNRFLAAEAHARGLAIGLKNDLDQIPGLVDVYDFAINESCLEYNECERLTPFVQAGKTVFHIEYQNDIASICARGKLLGFSSVKKRLALDAWSASCQ